MNTPRRSSRSLVTLLALAVMLLAAGGVAPAFAHCAGDEGAAGGSHRHDCGKAYHQGAHPCGAHVVATSLDRCVDWPLWLTPYDTLCNPGSPQYAPRACMAYYECL
jgi:hypothetical protein